MEEEYGSEKYGRMVEPTEPDPENKNENEDEEEEGGLC